MLYEKTAKKWAEHKKNEIRNDKIENNEPPTTMRQSLIV